MIQRLAWLLIVGGILAALVFFLKWFFTISLIAFGFRIAIAVVIVGILLLLASTIWERYKAAKKEEFKEVKH